MKEVPNHKPINFKPLLNFVLFLLMVAGMGFSGYMIGGSVGRKNEVPAYLTIVSVTPDSNTALAINDTVAVQFSAPLKKSTISKNNFFAHDLRNEKMIPVIYRYNDANQTLYFSFPEYLFARETDIQVELTEEITDLHDSRMKEVKRLFYSIAKKPEPPKIRKKSQKKKQKASVEINVQASKVQKRTL